MPAVHENHLFALISDDFQPVFVQMTQGGQGFTQSDQLGIELQHHAVLPFPPQGMIQPRTQESLFVLWIGDILTPAVAVEFLSAALAYRRRQFRIFKAGEEQERCLTGEFLAHEQQRQIRREQYHPRRQLERLKRDKLAKPVAVHAIADLIMILRTDHETLGG